MEPHSKALFSIPLPLSVIWAETPCRTLPWQIPPSDESYAGKEPCDSGLSVFMEPHATDSFPVPSISWQVPPSDESHAGKEPSDSGLSVFMEPHSKALFSIPLPLSVIWAETPCRTLPWQIPPSDESYAGKEPCDSGLSVFMEPHATDSFPVSSVPG